MALSMQQQLDSANRCTRLPPSPDGVTIWHTSQPHHPAPAEVLIRVGDQLTVSAASIDVALSRPCVELVREYDQPITTVSVGRGHSSRAGGRGIRGMRRGALARLRSTYQAEEVALVDVSVDAPPHRLQSDHQCHVLFVRRRRSISHRLGQTWHSACQLPFVGGALQGALRIASSTGIALLTPTSRPTPMLRALRFLPWQAQRFAARCWVQSMLQAQPLNREGTLSHHRERRRPATSVRHPMEAVRTMPMLTPAQCEAAVSEAEAHAATVGGWQTDRHISYATTDIPIRKLPRLEALWNTSLFPAIEAEARTRLGLGAGSRVLPLDVFVVKYSANEPSGQRRQARAKHERATATLEGRHVG